MGKERINRLLKKLEEDQKKDIKNSAAIFSIAQIAVNQLNDICESGNQPNSAPPQLNPKQIDKQELLRRYQDYNGCRKAAKTKGIKFKKTPSWDKLICAFNFAETLGIFCHNHIKENPNSLLHDFSVEICL